MQLSRRHFTFFLTAASAGTALPALAVDERAKPDEARAMLAKAMAHIKSVGRDKAFADFMTKPGPWVDRDLYLLVFRLDGTSLAHGVNAKQIGMNLIDRKDIDGKEFIRERMELAKSKPTFWQDYKFQNPVTKKIEAKTSYCERQADTVVCAGVYK